MKKLLLLLMLTLTALNAITTDSLQSAGFSKLSKQEQVEILKLVTDKAEVSNSIVVPNVDKMQQWVNLGSSIGKGLASSAKELGVTVNEFSKTGVGQWTMFLIIFKVLGSTIMHIFAGFIILITGFFFTTYMLNKRVNENIIYEDGKVIQKTKDKLDDDVATPFWFAYGIILAISIIIMLTGGN